jgi:hypothetical protein
VIRDWNFNGGVVYCIMRRGSDLNRGGEYKSVLWVLMFLERFGCQVVIKETFF